jgi:putative DNA primase/helicase
MATAETIAKTLGGRKAGGGWMARCPAHDDVRLAAPGDVLMVGEGIETCLAAMQATGNPAWAALSTSGLRALDLPKDVRDVIVLADGDDAGEAAARDCAWRWKREGRRVRIARPPQGMDFNDMLMDRTPRIKEGVQ